MVPPEVHQAATKGEGKLPVAEPIARNVGVRFARRDNHWLLSTNTDVLVGGKGPRLSDVVADLQPGFHTAPRYEVPEWMWESLSRVNAEVTQEQIDDWVSRSLPLVMVRSYEGFTFDGGGDFQLFHRSAFEAIGGFDETMLKGWHVDSNFAKRMLQHCGEVGEFVGQLRILHTNHNRTYTQYTVNRAESNDLEKYFFGDVPTVSRAGQSGWGLPEFPLRVLALGDYDDIAKSLTQVVLSGNGVPETSSASDESSRLMGVDFRVTLPFLLDAVMSGYSVREIEYLGTRPEFGAALYAALSVLQRHETSQDPSSGVDGRVLVVVDCTPIASPGQPQGLSELSVQDRRAMLDVLLAARNLVQNVRAGVLDQPIFAFVNFEGNVLTPIARSVVGEASAQYYARLRYGTMLPSPEGSIRLRATGARFILRLARASGMTTALSRVSGLGSRNDGTKDKTGTRGPLRKEALAYDALPRRVDRRILPPWIRTDMREMVKWPSVITRRLAFSRLRYRLVESASHVSVFAIPEELKASVEDPFGGDRDDC